MFADDEVADLLEGTKQILGNGGTMVLTTLVANARFGDRYLAALGKKSLLVPRRLDRLGELLAS